jgi:hypothetical protein
MNFREQIEAVIQAVAFHSPTTFSWFGQLSPQLSSAVRRAITPQIARKYLAWTLQIRLYSDFYCRGFPMPAEQSAIARPDVGAPAFVRQLSAANSGNGSVSRGWTVRAVSGCDVVLRGANLELHVHPRDCLTPPRGRLEPGTAVGLRLPKELPDISPGFHVVLGNKELVGAGAQALVRLYWNLAPDGAIAFVRRATSVLNREELPFKIKAVNDPARFGRRDAVVLYIRKLDYRSVSELMGEVYGDMAQALKDGEPAFTKRLAAGLGLAEDPGEGASFGSHRCGILAEGLIRAHEQHKRSLAGKFQVVNDCFDENRIDLNKPYLTGDAADDYDFGPRARSANGGRAIASTPRTGARALLRAAMQIGQRLVRDAVWHEESCNWMAFAEEGTKPGDAGPTRQYRALARDLYSGTSGIALFLSELHAASGDMDARRCALGAIRRSLSCFDAAGPHPWCGLYQGGLGIVVAAARVGTRLQEMELLDRAAEMLRGFVHEDQPCDELDVISGAAGAVSALIMLADLLRDAAFLEVAKKIGDDLLRTAEKSIRGYSWRTLPMRSRNNLTGFAHGTAGIGFALMELYRVTRVARYREGAERAFAYERHWFDSDAGNWPDFRDQPPKSRATRLPLRFATGWCHGAPGIAVSRLRAYEVTKDPEYKNEATVALQTTCRITKQWLRSGTGGHSLCHGLSGNADILLYGWQVVGRDFAEGLATAQAVAAATIAAEVERSAAWSGEDGEGPGLMLGTAGMGYLFLRLHDPRVQSVLCPIAHDYTGPQQRRRGA